VKVALCGQHHVDGAVAVQIRRRHARDAEHGREQAGRAELS
jgi:hypothetical protein